MPRLEQSEENRKDAEQAEAQVQVQYVTDEEAKKIVFETVLSINAKLDQLLEKRN